MIIKRIVLREGAPPLAQLRKELRLNFRSSVVDDYDEVYGGQESLIGRRVENELDAVNEERLMLIGGEIDILDLLGGAADFDEPDAVKKDGSYVEWEWVLIDADNEVWSEIKTFDSPEDASQYEINLAGILTNAKNK